eukprot:CAMPEP_0183361032 /NCGR_PEP_ID=MMETSP0164_2-20130417/56208_1 /TAXON_ID=221442 /ORGANISM="Coccolithus pelagicus ssp braarudi, Strain PLY182g" /LENGTH=98 /DNA_ID=CAMNT_0025535485 /DNA_START=519 /DNA_END=815 /DNA_ORIENTATION=-
MTALAISCCGMCEHVGAVCPIMPHDTQYSDRMSFLENGTRISSARDRPAVRNEEACEEASPAPTCTRLASARDKPSDSIVDGIVVAEWTEVCRTVSFH